MDVQVIFYNNIYEFVSVQKHFSQEKKIGLFHSLFI